MHVVGVCFIEDIASISWINVLFACFIALIEIGRYTRHSVSLWSPSYTRGPVRRRSPRRTPPRRPPPRRSPLRRSPPRRSPPRRSPPRRNGRSWFSTSFEDTRDARNDHNAYGPFTWRIREAPIPRGLEKPPQMDSYDGTTDPDEHIENIEAVLTYRSVQGAVT